MPQSICFSLKIRSSIPQIHLCLTSKKQKEIKNLLTLTESEPLEAFTDFTQVALAWRWEREQVNWSLSSIILHYSLEIPHSCTFRHIIADRDPFQRGTRQRFCFLLINCFIGWGLLCCLVLVLVDKVNFHYLTFFQSGVLIGCANSRLHLSLWFNEGQGRSRSHQQASPASQICWVRRFFSEAKRWLNKETHQWSRFRARCLQHFYWRSDYTAVSLPVHP